MMKTRTDYDRRHMEELQRVAGKTYAKGDILHKRFTAVGLWAGCAVTGLTLILLLENLVLASVLWFLGGLALLWALFYYPFTGWASSLNLGEARWDNEFFLEKKHILAMCRGESARYPYDQCSMLLEAEGDFYFFTSQGKGIVLDKKNLQGGTVDELRAFLEEKCATSVTWVGRKSQGPKAR